jgi:hypothetical protein
VLALASQPLSPFQCLLGLHCVALDLHG